MKFKCIKNIILIKIIKNEATGFISTHFNLFIHLFNQVNKKVMNVEVDDRQILHEYKKEIMAERKLSIQKENERN